VVEQAEVEATLREHKEIINQISDDLAEAETHLKAQALLIRGLDEQLKKIEKRLQTIEAEGMGFRERIDSLEGI
jgi:chromosome segregation ATPase